MRYVYWKISFLYILPRYRHVSSESISEVSDVHESSDRESIPDGCFGDGIWEQIKTSVAAFVIVTNDAARVWMPGFAEMVQRIRAQRERIKRMAGVSSRLTVRPDGAW